MSRLAKKPIVIPSKVQVTSTDGVLMVKGSKATLSRPVHSSVNIDVTSDGVQVSPKNTSKLSRALTGTFAAHIRAMIKGVEEPFKKNLILTGVGYKVELKDGKLVFAVGFSHPVVVAVPEGITASVAKNVISIEGSDKQAVGQVAAELRSRFARSRSRSHTLERVLRTKAK